MKKKLVALLLVAVSMIGFTAITSQAEATKGTLNIKVYDEDSEGGIKGVEFTIYDTSGKEVKTIKSNKNGVAKTQNLPLGNYTVKETVVPDKYEADPTPINFSITGNWSFVKLECANKQVEKKVETIDTSLYLDIKDVDGGKKTYVSYTRDQIKELGALKFKITDSQGKEFTTEYTVDGDFYYTPKYGNLKGIAPGEAIIEQTNKVDGLKQLKKTKVEVEYRNSIRVPLELEQSSLKVTLVDEETGQPLQNTTFALKDSFNFWYTAKTNSTGTATFDHVTTGKSLILQSDAPEGYETFSPKELKINSEKQNELTIKTKKSTNKLGTFIFACDEVVVLDSEFPSRIYAESRGDGLISDETINEKEFDPHHTFDLRLYNHNKLIYLIDKDGKKFHPISNESNFLLFENLPDGEYELFLNHMSQSYQTIHNSDALEVDVISSDIFSYSFRGENEFYDYKKDEKVDKIKVNVSSKYLSKAVYHFEGTRN